MQLMMLAANSRSRLPSLAGAVSCLSRQPSRLWSTGPPDRPPCVIGEAHSRRVLRGTFKGQPAAIKEVGERPNARRRWRGPGDTSPGLLYVVMELIDGRNLAELRRKGPFSEDDLRSLMT
uniref:Protein kinase domain-containing protein n=1 Tax=Macrostomum lignano TaxID=282301 RepID=A0A1I8F308_9PLAT